MKQVDGNKQAVCRAYLAAADGVPYKSTNGQSVLAPGTHQLAIECVYSIIHPSDRGAIAPFRSTIPLDAKFEERKRYFIWADVSDQKCKAWLSEDQPPPPAPLWKALLP